MKPKRSLPANYLILLMVLVACNPANPSPLEVTRIVPQIVEATRLVTPMELPSTSNPGPTLPFPTASAPNPDTAYYDGLVAITTYTTLLENGLNEKAYQMLCQDGQNNSLEEFKRQKVSTVHILAAQPYSDYARQAGIQPLPETDTRLVFHLKVYVAGEGGMFGSVPNGIHNFRGWVVWEDGEWRVCGFGTS